MGCFSWGGLLRNGNTGLPLRHKGTEEYNYTAEMGRWGGIQLIATKTQRHEGIAAQWNTILPQRWGGREENS